MEATFLDGTKLVTCITDPLTHGSLIPGELLPEPGEIELNSGRLSRP